MSKFDKKVIRNAILDYVKIKVDDHNYKNDINPISMEGYTLDSIDAMMIISNTVGTVIMDEKNEYIEMLMEDECFHFEEDGIIKVVKVPLEFKLQQIQSKYNITVNSVKDNIVQIVGVAGGIIIATVYSVGFIYFSNSTHQKYENSVIVNEDKEYQMKEIYVVYDTDNVYFCNRDIYKLMEDDKINGTFVSGYGKVDEYYYRDEIYSYFDIKTGKEICHDHEDGFYIEKLMDFYNVNQIANKNYKINLSEISSDINADYLLSRNPGLKRK